MTEMIPVTEADLHAYVDGQLDPDRRAAIEAHLKAQVQGKAIVEPDYGEMVVHACLAVILEAQHSSIKRN